VWRFSEVERWPYRGRMTESPRPPGSGNPDDRPADPTVHIPSADPTSAPPQPPTSGAGGYAPPPPSAPDGFAPPSSAPDGFAPPPSSGAGGYGPPPGGPYPPQGGYAAPGHGAPGHGAPGPGQGYGAGYGVTSGEDRTWILVTHFGGAAGAFLGGGCAGWIAPLVALLARGNQSPAVRAHAVQALNFQLLWSIIALIGWITSCIGIGLFIGFGAMIVAIIFGVIAGSKAAGGEPYRYPMSYPFVR
jgi:uncharacterized protein